MSIIFADLEALETIKIEFNYSMPHTLKNKNIEVFINLPNENYNFSRFDWTGKVVEVKFQNIPMSTVEKMNCENEHHYGKAFYNEFGIDTALGFQEAEIGGWFHKIGVGLLRKDSHAYLFNKKYDIEPAKFKIRTNLNKVLINCTSKIMNGYSYVLKKEIQLLESGFRIDYHLENTGEKSIVTTEYVHNFTAIDKMAMGQDYVLRFPFQLKPRDFKDTVNPEEKVKIGHNSITFNGQPSEQFFFSKLAGNKSVVATWELINIKNRIGIRETGSFQTKKVNLWGCEHVISPELFFDIHLRPGQSTAWSRTYDFYRIL